MSHTNNGFTSFFETTYGKAIRWLVLCLGWYGWIVWFDSFSHNLGYRMWGLPRLGVMLLFTVLAAFVVPLRGLGRWLVPAIMAIVGGTFLVP